MGTIEPTGLGRLFEACGPSLRLYARQWAGAATADDLVQEAFVRLATQSPVPTRPRAWLFRTVRNAAISHIRTAAARRHHEERLGESAVPWFEPDPAALVDAESAREAMAALPQDQREGIVLRIWGDLTFREIADVVGRPHATVFRQYADDLEAMRRRLESSCRTKND